MKELDMNSRMKRTSVIALTMVAVVGAAIGYQAFGAALAGQPTIVVTVNLGHVMEHLTQRSDSDARLKKMRDELLAEQERRQNEVRAMEEKAKGLQSQLEGATEAKKREIEGQLLDLQEQAALAALNFQAWQTISAEKVDIEAALSMQDLYRSVKLAAAQMASTSRYDLVLVDDSQGDLTMSSESRISRMDQVRQQISARRMLYVNPTIDITEDLIQRMNNAYKAAGPKAP
jgi:Skp family chaperone for outer membrane proteins